MDNPLMDEDDLLPTYLERVDGTIRITGYRVSLFRILDALLEGLSIERISEMYPTVPLGKLWEVVRFCDQHIDVMRKYHADQRAIFAASLTGYATEGPTLRELRQRRANKDESKK